MCYVFVGKMQFHSNFYNFFVVEVGGILLFYKSGRYHKHSVGPQIERMGTYLHYRLQ